jgi:hypothetical protein
MKLKKKPANYFFEQAEVSNIGLKLHFLKKLSIF